jgi:hypothetical protein
MSNRYGLYTALFDAGSNNLVLNQINSVGTRTNKGIFTVHPSGAIDPAAHLMSTARPVQAFATNDLLTLFGDASAPVSITAGLYCTQGSQLVYRRRVEGGGFSSGNDHIVQTVESGFLHCTEFGAEAESQSPVEAALEFIALSSDGGDPFAISFGQAIPAANTAPAYNSAYYMGPVYFNAGQLTGVIRSRVRPGIGFAARYADGGAFPRAACASIAIRQPAIEIDFLNVDVLNSTVATFLSAYSNTLAVYYQKAAVSNDARVAAGSASHIKVTSTAGAWGSDEIAVRNNEDGTATIVVMPTGTLALSTASTIP